MVVPGRGAVSYERGTPVTTNPKPHTPNYTWRSALTWSVLLPPLPLSTPYVVHGPQLQPLHCSNKLLVQMRLAPPPPFPLPQP